MSSKKFEIAPDHPIAIRAGEELQLGPLQRFLNASTGIGTIQDVKQFPSGFSNLTYALKTTQGEYILRRPPFGANIKSAHDMGREFQVLTLLGPKYQKVPRPVALCNDLEVMGTPFYIMSRLPGVILRAQHALAGLPHDVLKSLSQQLIDNLVALHSIDVVGSGLIQLGKPDGYVQRQVDGWVARYKKAQTDLIKEMDSVANWIQTNIPTSGTPTFLHNDYKYDNIVFNPHLTEIVGVLDWEMATVGDPLMDLGATLAYWCEAGDPPITRLFNISWLPGNLTRTELIARYAEQSRRDVCNINFYYAFGLFKNAVIAQQIYSRWKSGFTKDPRFGQLIEAVRALSKQAATVIQKP